MTPVVVPFKDRSRITEFWRLHKHQLPILFQIFREYCAMPAGGGPSESQFSVMGHLLSQRRMGTSTKHVEDLTLGKTFFPCPRGESLPSMEVKLGLRTEEPEYFPHPDAEDRPALDPEDVQYGAQAPQEEDASLDMDLSFDD